MRKVKRSVCAALRRAALLVTVLCACLGSAAGIAVAAPESGGAALPTPASAYHPRVSLVAQASGSAAVEALGNDLPGVARAYGMSGPALAQRLQRDRHLTVDRDGWLYYLDPALSGAAEEEAAAAAPAALALTIPLADTFLLHSLPGADRVIYLDFDGHLLSGTAWNSAYNGGADIVCPPYDIDGLPASFSDEELTRIQQMWRRVAEDYAPFAVDVTTEYPGDAALTRLDIADTAYGVRVLISPISKYFGGYGGIAYVGVFDMVGDRFKPALVFPENLGNNAKYVGEAASHETGHTLGLYHDGTTAGVEYYSGTGTGETGWAPIMGSSYGKNVTQWSKGEYPAANNLEDDLSVMSIAARIPYRSDDHGDTFATATPLAAGEAVTVTGLVGRTEDVDVFRVASGAGTLALSALTAPLGTNLDVQLELWDATGALLASANPLELLAAQLSVQVEQGTYYITVQGVGMGAPLSGGYSDYASLGLYSLSATVPAPVGGQPPVAVIETNATTGFAPLAVQLSAAGSYDLDNDIVTYAWDLGDGSAVVVGPIALHTFTGAGDYAVTLTVTDSQGNSGSAQVVISVTAETQENSAPTAVLTVSTQDGGTAPLQVAFGADGSVDPDGSIVSYEWSFGDGATDTAEATAHIYTAPGVYTASLVVTDDKGAKDTAQTQITVLEPAENTMRVKTVSLEVVPVRSGWQAKAIVMVVDASGRPVPKASIKAAFSGAVTGTVSGITGQEGTVTLLSRKYSSNATPEFFITGVTKKGWVYLP